ncbi:MAG: DUF3857 domain-containing protein [Roseibacillus sp.]
MKVYLTFVLWVLSLSDIWAAREGLSRDAPEIYTEQLEALLTPVEEVLGWENSFLEGEDSDGTVLLSERVTWVNDDGRCVDVLHAIYQAHTDAGGSQLESDSIRFSALLEKPTLVLARTLNKDGKWIEVGEKEAFLQRGRGDSESQIYDDSEEVVLIFPEVEAGAITQSIVVLEDKSARVEGEYFAIGSWEAGWPYLMRRRVLDLSETMAERLQEKVVGRGVPRRVRLDAPEGRWRAQWEKKNRERAFWERSRAPSTQIGPASFLTTWESWDDLSRWYSKKLEKNSGLGAELLQEVETWVGEETDKEKIANILLERVSLEIRYTGLEFGHSGWEPYSCDTVWKRKFGDCKDKANLLVQLLGKYDIEARLVLVNTRHAGLVNRKSPSCYEFNHAILAIKDGDEWQFCDATIPGARVGELSPSSSDREVYLVGESGGEWARTPRGEVPQLDYKFETEFDSEGRLSGWLELRATGFYELSYRDDYRERSRISSKRALTSKLQNFFEGVEVVDVEFPEEEGAFVIKAFFTGQPVEPDTQGRRSLPFPTSTSLFVDFGEADTRETDFFLWRDNIDVECRISLADGLAVEGLPQPISLLSEGYRVEAGWRMTECGCQAELTVSCGKSLLTPDELLAAAQANRAFSNWSESPVFVKEGKAGKVQEMKESGPGMPLLSSGEAQLELVEQWFPLGADAARRRSALRDVLRFFPQDKEVAFDVKLRLAYLDYYEDKYLEAAQQYEALSGSSNASKENIGFAKYMLATTQKELAQHEEALGTMKVLAEQKDLSEYRRGWSAAWAGEWLLPDEPGEAERYFRMALAIEGDFREVALQGIVSALVKREERSKLAKVLIEELPEQDEILEEEFALVLETSQGAKEAKVLEEALVLALEELEEDDSRRTLFESHRKELADSLGKRELVEALHKSLKTLLETEKPEYFRRVQIDGDLKTQADFEKEMGELYNVKHDQWLAHAAEYVHRFEANESFPEFLWRLLGYINWLENPGNEKEEFFEKMMLITDQIPHSDGNYWESQFVKATWLEERTRYEEANEVYSLMPGDPDFDQDFSSSAANRQGLVLEKMGRWSEAVVCFRRTEDERRTVLEVVNHLVRAGVLLVHLDRADEALEVFGLLRDVPVSLYEEEYIESQVKEAITLSESPEESKKFWEQTRGAWAEGLGKGSELNLQEPFGAIILTGDELTNFDEEFPKALKDKDKEKQDGMTAGLYAVASIFPSQVQTMTTLVYTYLKPNEPQGEMGPEKALKKFAEIVLEAPTDQAVREFCLRLCGGLSIDLGEKEEAFNLLARCVDEINESSSREHRERAVYLYLLSALRAEKKSEDVIARVNEITSEEMLHIGRFTLVQNAAQLINQSEGTEEALDFVMKQMKVRAGDATSEVLEQLEAYAAELKEGELAKREIEEAMNEWISALELSWFEYVEPREVGDAELDEARSFFRTGETDRHDLEQFKLMVGVVLSPDVEEELAGNALEHCFFAQKVWTLSDKFYFERLIDAVYDERFPTAVRSQLYFSAVVGTSLIGEAQLFEVLKEKPVWGGEATAQGKELLENFALVAQAKEEGGIDRVLECLRKIGKEGDFLAMDITFLSNFVKFLFREGETEVIAKLLKESKEWKVAGGASAEMQKERLEWSRSLRRVAPYLDLNEQLKEQLSGLLEGYQKDAPEDWFERFDLYLNDDWTLQEKRGIQAARVSDEGWTRSRQDGRLWFLETDTWVEDEEGEVREEELLEAIKTVLEWSQDFEGAFPLLSLLDHELSEPAEAKLAEMLEPFDDPRETPEIYAVKRLWEAKNRDEIVKHRLSGLQSAANETAIFQGFVDYVTLLFTIENANARESERVLDEMDSERLLSSELLPLSLHLFQSLGTREVELEIATERAAAEIHASVLNSWQHLELYELKQACELAIMSDAGKQLPVEWAESNRKRIPEDEDRLTFEVLYALAKKNWSDLEQFCSELDKLNSGFYSTAPLGLALFHQEKYQESLEPLQAAIDMKFLDWELALDLEPLLIEAKKKSKEQQEILESVTP